MYCFQCEQRTKGGCSVFGACGKGPSTSDLQDLLVYQAKGLGWLLEKLDRSGKAKPEAAADLHLLEALFTTVTNVNFDDARLMLLLGLFAEDLDKARAALVAAGEDAGSFPPAARFVPEKDVAGLQRQAATLAAIPLETDPDVRSLHALLLAGLKGMAAYADHALVLGASDATVTAFFRKALAAMADDVRDINALVALNLECGRVNIRCMELLDAAHTARFGHPVPHKVQTGVRKGPAILVSGHDLVDLAALLEQTAGKGINVYTHGEMLPAHGYPGLHKHPHLAGNYGGAWQDQQKEFAAFPGAILMTTNCIQKPVESYRDNIFTCNLVAWPGIRHVENRDFSSLIERALALGGFPADAPEKEITVGFAHNAVLGAAEKIIGLVKTGKIRHFYVIGGCDGAKSGRNYFTDFATQVPADCLILTLACGKYRFNKLDFGEIEGIPRLLDIGQCNDAYSAIRIAGALAEAFKCGLNDLPLSLVLSWYEQKAVVVLLSLLSLGIKNIRLGPTLPEFISENVLKVLVENFAIAPTTTAEADLAATLKK